MPMNHKVVKLRRGTTDENATLVGEEGEVTIDTEKKVAIVHDGLVVGGFPMRREDKEETRLRYLTFRAALTQQGIPSLGFSAPENAPIPVAILEGDIISGAASFSQNVGQSIQDHFMLPSDWVGPLQVEILWRANAISGNVHWRAETCGLAIGGLLSNATFNQPNSIIVAVADNVPLELMTTTLDLDITNMVPEGEVFFRFMRYPNDTLAQDAELLALRFILRVKGR